MWDKIHSILKGIKLFISTIKVGFKNASKNDKIVLTDSDKEMIKKLREGKLTTKELFDLVDSEGDGSGGISKDEFGRLLAKLEIDNSEHRINEIFTKCKTNKA